MCNIGNAVVCTVYMCFCFKTKLYLLQFGSLIFHIELIGCIYIIYPVCFTRVCFNIGKQHNHRHHTHWRQ